MARADFHPNRPVIEIADVLRRHGDAYRHAHAGHLGRVERRVMSAITACRTGALGGHIEACDDCGMTRIAYNSCHSYKRTSNKNSTACTEDVFMLCLDAILNSGVLPLSYQ